MLRLTRLTFDNARYVQDEVWGVARFSVDRFVPACFGGDDVWRTGVQCGAGFAY